MTLVLDAPARTGTYQLVPDKCVLELVVRTLRLPLVWIRLRVVSASVGLGDPGWLHAEIASTPLFASLPFPRLWTLRSVPRRVRVRVEAELPPLAVGPAVHVSAIATAAERRWSVPLDVRLVALDEQKVVLAVRGNVARPPGVLVLRSPLFVDAAAEFQR